MSGPKPNSCSMSREIHVAVDDTIGMDVLDNHITFGGVVLML